MKNAAAWVLAALFLISTLWLSSKTTGLQKQNKSLSDETARLQQFVKELEEKDRTLEEKFEKEKAELKNKLDTVIKENHNLKEELDKSKTQLSSATEEKTYLEDILIHKTKELEKIKVNLGSIKMGSESESVADTQMGVSASPKNSEEPALSRKNPRTEGRVLAVNEEHGFVVVDLGKVDGITKDTLFSVNKNGEIIGSLKVLEIRDVMTACNIKNLNQGKKIELNDLVLTRK